MEQRQYRTQQDPTQYRPVATPDYTDSLSREYQRQQQAEQRNYDQLVRNNETMIANARNDKSLEELGKFSATLTDYLVERQEKKNEEERAEGMLDELQSFRMGELSTEEYDRLMKVAQGQDAEAAAAAKKILAKNGNNYSASSMLSNPTTWKEVGRRQGRIMAGASQYDGWMEQQLSGKTFNSRAEYLAERNRLKKEFFKMVGATGHNAQFLAKSLYPQVMKSDIAQEADWTKRFNISESDKRKDEAFQRAESDPRLSVIFQGLEGQLDSQGKPLGYAAMWDLIETRIAKMAETGVLSLDQIQDLGDEPIPGGNGKTYRDVYGPRIRSLEQAAMDARTNRFKRGNQQDAVDQGEFVKDARALLTDPNDKDGSTMADYEKVEAAWRARFPGVAMPKELTDLKGATNEGRALQKEMDLARKLDDAGMLDLETLQTFSIPVQKEFAQSAKATSSIRGENLDEMDNRIKAMVQGGPRGGIAPAESGAGRQDYSVLVMTSRVQAEFRANLKKYKIAGVENPVEAAWADTEKWFNDNGAAMQDQDGNYIVTPDPQDVTGQRMKAAEELRQLNEKIKDPNVLDTAFSIFDEAELKDIEISMGKPGFDIPEKARYVGKMLGISPLAVINRQRKAQGMPELLSPAQDALDNTMTERQKRLLARLNTSRQANHAARDRALGSTGVFTPETVPHGFGPVIQKAAAQHNIPAPILAAMLHQESGGFNMDVITGKRNSSAGAQGIAQFMPATAAELGVDPLNPNAAIEGAARYLRQLLDMFGGDMRLALTAYNGGMGSVQKHGGPIPGSAENQNYYKNVMRHVYRYGGGRQALQTVARSTFGGPSESNYTNNTVSELSSTGSVANPNGSVAKPQATVPYINQRSALNGEGDKQCFSASATMVANSYGISVNYNKYNEIRSRYGDTTSASSQIGALRELGLDASVSDNGSLAELEQLAAGGKATAIGIQHNEGSGHWIVVTGVTPNGDFIVNDPYGRLKQTRNGGWEYANSKEGYGGRGGENVIYSRNFLRQVWIDRGAGTGRIMRINN